MRLRIRIRNGSASELDVQIKICRWSVLIGTVLLKTEIAPLLSIFGN